MDQTSVRIKKIGFQSPEGLASTSERQAFETTSVDQTSHDLSALVNQDPTDTPVLLLDTRLSESAVLAAEAQAAAWSQQFADSASAPTIGVFIQHDRQRSYLATFLTLVYYWVSRLLFGVRKSPEDAVAIYFHQANQLADLAGQISSVPDAAAAYRWSWLEHIRSFVDRPQSQLDRLLHAAVASQYSLQQVEADSTCVRPRRTHWKQRGTLAVSAIVGIAKLGKDWWNWRVFSSENNRSVASQHETANSLADQPTARTSLLAWCSLVLCSIAVIGTQTDYPLFEPDEARNSQLAINIYETGDWVSLRLGPEPYWDKPPAVAWGTAVAYHLFGVSSWSTRLVSNVTAILTVLMTFYFGRRLVGFRAAWLGAFLLLLCLGFVICGRYATMDAAITCCATAMLGSIYMATRQNDSAQDGVANAVSPIRYRYWLVASVACGIGLLVKGPVIGVLTLPPLFVWMWLTGNRSLLRWQPWVVMSVVALGIAGPWFVTMGLTEPDFLVYFFWKHHVVRFSDAFNHREPFWFYGPVLLIGTFPASLLLPTLIPLFRRYGQACRQALTPRLGLVTLYALWVVGFFSLSDSKLPTYILPSFPAVALLYAVAGVAFTSDLRQQSFAQWNRYLRYFLSIPKRSAVTFAIAVVAFSVVSVVLFKQNAWATWFSGIAILGLLLSALAWLGNKRPVIAIGTSLSLGLLFIVTITGYVLPEVSSFRSIQKAAAALHEGEEFKDLPIVFYSHENYGCQIWLPQESVQSFDEYDMVKAIDYLHRQQTCLLVSRWDAMEMLRSNLDESLQLSSIKGARHMYLCHPAADTKLPSDNQAVQHLAGRLESVTFTR